MLPSSGASSLKRTSKFMLPRSTTAIVIKGSRPGTHRLAFASVDFPLNLDIGSMHPPMTEQTSTCRNVQNRSQQCGSRWYLKRHGPPAPRIFTHHMRGRVERNSQRWLAGSTIAAVNKVLEKRGKTLPSHPTLDYIAIGAWIAASNHGNSADSSNNDESAIQDVKLLDMRQNTTEIVSFKEARRRFSGARKGDYCVVDVAFNPVDNRDVQKMGIVMDSPEAAAQWLAPGTLLRMAFLGAARPHAIGLRWSAPYSDTTHPHPPPTIAGTRPFLASMAATASRSSTSSRGNASPRHHAGKAPERISTRGECERRPTVHATRTGIATQSSTIATSFS